MAFIHVMSLSMCGIMFAFTQHIIIAMYLHTNE